LKVLVVILSKIVWNAGDTHIQLRHSDAHAMIFIALAID